MKPFTTVDAVADTHFQRNVSNAWERFLSTGECDASLVRDVIFSSWKRCAGAAGREPRRHMPMVDVGRLERARASSAGVMGAAQAVFSSMQDALHATRSVILLTDAQGIILDSFGARPHIDHAADRNLRAGGNCHEIAGGTNAIGTALAVGQAVQVHAGEHYYEYVKGWTCSAALIRDPVDRDILGVVDISGTKDTFNAHNLALALSLSGQIEGLIGLRETRTREQLLEWARQRAGAWHNDAVLVLDQKGRLVFKNAAVEEELARRGIRARLDPGCRLLHADAATSSAQRAPGWLRPDWMQPWVCDGREQGYLLVIPRSGQIRAGESATAPAASLSQRCNVDSAFDAIVGESEVLRRSVARARRFAASTLPVLVCGETGVGKEEFALAMHRASQAANGPFVAVNCGALLKDLALTELFGYADGAFTGSTRGGRAGKFEHAHGGTLFLDEIGDLTPEVQVQLLRVLQDGCVTRVGDHRARRVTVRVLSATNIDLRQAVDAGRFRRDLYFRIATATVQVPSLRERPGDVPVLTRHFLRGIAGRHGVAEKHVHPELLARLSAREWPGNVRELKNLVEALWHLCEGPVLVASLLEECDPTSTPGGAVHALSPLQRSERDEILHALEIHAGNLTRTANHLAIARSTLYLKLARYAIRR